MATQETSRVVLRLYRPVTNPPTEENMSCFGVMVEFLKDNLSEERFTFIEVEGKHLLEIKCDIKFTNEIGWVVTKFNDHSSDDCHRLTGSVLGTKTFWT